MTGQDLATLVTICKSMQEENAKLLIERRDAVLILTISNPPFRNAIGPSIYEPGIEAIRAAHTDSSIQAIVLTGEGEHFCGGGNLHRLKKTREGPRSVQFDGLSKFHSWIELLRACPQPVIAAVEGACAGGGFSLALACDLIVAAEDAKFVMSYIKVGLTPDGGGTYALAKLLPRQIALELMLSADAISTQRLHQLGIVNRVCAPGQSLNDAIAWAKRLSLGPRRATRRIKQLLSAASENSLTSQLALERDSFISSLFDAECGEGIDAFFAKRRAKFPA